MYPNLEGSKGSGLIQYSTHWKYKLTKEEEKKFTSLTEVTYLHTDPYSSGRLQEYFLHYPPTFTQSRDEVGATHLEKKCGKYRCL